MNQKRAFSTLEAAEYVALSQSYLQKARMISPTVRDFDAPAHTRISPKKVVYLKEDLDAWLDRHKAETEDSGVAA